MLSGLATRCPACRTAFRVVPDQLRVSEGWVRCGRCSEVFNAAEALIDVETGTPRRLPDAGRTQSPAPGLAPLVAAPEPSTSDPETADVDIRLEPPLPGLAAADVLLDHAGVEPTAESAHESAAPSFDFAAADAEIDPHTADGAGPESPAGDDIRAEPAGTPLFVRRAERAQRWRRPGVRAALALLMLLGLLGLLGQATYTYRDLVAARFVAARPALEQGCEFLGCTIGAPHLIESLAVDSSGLVRVERSSVYKLSVTLRNRAGVEAALPALDLALTDGQGKLLARRVLRPTELGTSLASLGAGRELALHATLDVATAAPVAGYTVEIFYP
jgi:predicted Zn finger-like uncharacterized protein